MHEEVKRTFLAVPLFLKEDEQVHAYFTSNTDDVNLLSGADLLVAVPEAASKGETHTFDQLFEGPGQKRYPGLQRGDLPCIWVEDNTRQHFLVHLFKKNQDEIHAIMRDLVDAATRAKSGSLQDFEEDFQMRQTARNAFPDPQQAPAPSVPPWFAIAGFIAGVLTLLFFMGLVVASLFSYTVPSGGRFAVVVVLAFGAALSFAFVGGSAAGKGKIPLPFSKKNPLVFSVTGGIAVFVIILTLGYYLYASGEASDTFTATIRPHADGTPVITKGKIRLEYGDNAPTTDVTSSGEAEFKQIPHQYWGHEVKVLPQIEDYKEEYKTITLSDKPIDFTLTKIPVATTLEGQIVPPQKGKAVKILVEGESGEAVPDQYGRFTVVVHRKPGERVRISAWVNGKQVYDDYQILPGPVKLSLKE
jgi:hypothetical protein